MVFSRIQPSEGFRLGADGNGCRQKLLLRRPFTFGGIPPRSGWKLLQYRTKGKEFHPFGGIPPRSGWKRGGAGG